MTKKAQSIISFDPEKNTLMYAGKSVYLPERMSVFLNMLILSDGKTLSKEEILAECWGKDGIVVSHSSIRQLVTKLRKKIIELEHSADIIVNLPRHGYALTPGHIQYVKKVSSPVDERALKGLVDKLKVTDQSNSKVLRKMMFFTLLLLSGIFGYHAFNKEDYSKVDYFPFHNKAEVTYYAQNSFVDGFHLIDRLSKLDFKYPEISAASHVYFNHSDTDNISAYFCTNEIYVEGAECHTILIFRHSKKVTL